MVKKVDGEPLWIDDNDKDEDEMDENGKKKKKKKMIYGNETIDGMNEKERYKKENLNE